MSSTEQSHGSETTSAAFVAARSEGFDQRFLALRRELSERTFSGYDEHGSIEVRVDPSGQVLEVAVNQDKACHSSPRALAESVLRAASQAQRQASEVCRDRTAYYLGI